MPPDLIVAAVTTWLALVLVLPKRSWSEIPRRLLQLAAGERRTVFGPASPGTGQPSGLRVLWLLRANALPALECGVPLFLCGLVLGAYGRQRKREHELLWAETQAGLAWRLLDGELEHDDVNRRLASLGWPPLRATPASETDATFERPPVAWTKEWEAERFGSSAPEHVEKGAQIVPFRPAHDGRLKIHTLGGLSIRLGDEELAPALMRRQVLAFLWLLLLAWAVDSSPRPPERPLVAEELAPGIGRAQQSERLRGRLRDIRAYLPVALARVVFADGRIVRLELADCSVDILELRSLALEAKGAAPLLSDELLKESRGLLDESSGEFLPEWEVLERAVPEGRGAAREMIERVREDAERARVDLLVAVAEAFMARKDPARAVGYLEEVNSRRPDLEPAARRFVEALRDAGQPLRADQVSSTYGFSA